MRFNNYLNEADLPFGQFIQLLDKDCKKIIDLYKKTNSFLWRGTDHSKDFLIKKGHKTEREPIDIPVPIHKHLNKMFKKKFGWNVRDGIFVSPDLLQAEQYGGNLPYMFFPAKQFKYVWSPDIDDLNGESVITNAGSDIFFLPKKDRQAYLEGTYKYKEEDNLNFMTGDEVKSEFKEIFDTYTDKGLIVNLRKGLNGTEMSFKADNYYLVAYKHMDKLKRYWNMK